MMAVHYDPAQLRHCLDILQRCWYKPQIALLVAEDADWYVIMCVLIREGYLKKPCKRPPITAFLRLMQEIDAPCYLTRPKREQISRAIKRGKGINSPWRKNEGTHPNRIQRWQMMDKVLVALLKKNCPIQ